MPESEAVPSPAKTSRPGGVKHPAAAGPAPAPHPVESTPAPASVFAIPRQRWACAGILVVLFLIAFLLCGQAFLRMALPPVAIRNPKVSPEKAAAAKPPVPVATVTPAAAVSAPVAAPAAEPAAPPPPSARELAFTELHIQSIFYSRSNSSAVISGRRVRPNDRLPAGAVVVAIGPSSVTLEFDNERKTLALK